MPDSLDAYNLTPGELEKIKAILEKPAVESCKPPKTRNPLTGRCVNPPRATGKKGKAAAKPRRVTRKIRRT